MIYPKQLIDACAAVTKVFPHVDHLFISVAGRWFFCDDSFDGPLVTMDDVDISLLEDMVDALEESLPASFYIPDVLR